MRILYGGNLSLGSTSEHRLRAFRRSISGDLIAFPYERYLERGLPQLRKLGERFLVSSGIAALNRALIRIIEETRPECVWLDKPIYFHANTIRRIREIGAKAISYMPDDPYGPRNDFVWRHFKSALPYFWAHVVAREITRRDFVERGAERAVCVPFAFEPSLHFPPTSIGLSPPKDFDLSFVGSPYDDRAKWIIKLASELPAVRFGLFGPGWERHASKLRTAGISCQPAVWNDQYREIIWRSKLSLSFITRCNRDELSHKAIEIAASGTPVLVEPSPVHSRVFRHQESAYFFSNPNLLSTVIRDALSKGDDLKRVGANAARAVRSAKLSNDDIMYDALHKLELVGRSATPADAIAGNSS
jgi:spore maturation protein CgeB